MQHNQDMLSTLGMSDLKWRDAFYTWSNSKLGVNHIYCKLDMIPMNKEWTHKFANAEAIFAQPSFSNHSPTTIFFGSKNRLKGSRFHFFNFWNSYKEMHKVVQHTWNSIKVQDTPIYSLMKKVKSITGAQKRWASDLRRERNNMLATMSTTRLQPCLQQLKKSKWLYKNLLKMRTYIKMQRSVKKPS